MPDAPEPGRRRSPRAHRVRPILPRAVVESHRRERLAQALSGIVHEEGEVAVTVSRIVSRASSSRGTFYQLFRSKEACFEFACTWARERLLAAIGEAGRGADQDEKRRRGAIGAVLEVATELPGPIELCLLHSAADPEAREGVGDAASIRALARALAPAEDNPDVRTQLVAAGILAVVALRLHQGELEKLRAMGADLARLASLQLGEKTSDAMRPRG